MNIVDLAILKKMVAGGGGSGTDNYNDLSNLPQINGETLAGNKTAANLGLQDALTFDSAPTEDSTNPVESGGVYNALAGKQDNLTFDDDPTENSTNPVKSGGVYSALAGKQDNLTFDGVYNASTNKAATESTVTNAIAGLDVSALSVDADETISSISETDGKINVTKQDIAIVSNQVTAMTGYTKPSSAPATPAIQTSDTANQAFGKLEFKADTNQSNILYGLNTGVKNLLASLLRVGSIGSSGSTITYALQGDGSIVLNGSTTNSVAIFVITETGRWATSAINGVDGYFENISYKIALFDGGNASGSGVYLDIYRSGWAGRTTCGVGSNTTYDNPYIIRLCVPENKTLNNVIVKPMVCTLDAWNQSTDYQLPSLPNYDLTRLESEDRASLVEVVDSGAKNLYDVSAFAGYTTSELTMSKPSNGAITVTGTVAGAFVGVDLTTVTLAAGTYVLTGCPSGGGSSTYMLQINSPSYVEDVGNGAVFTLTSSTSVTVRIRISKTTSSITKIFTPMICTKAAFGVSQKFVPYRPDAYELVAQNIENQATLYAYRSGRVVTVNGYLNNISFVANSSKYLGTINDTIGKPPLQIRAVCNVGANAYSVGKQGYITIGTNGTINVTSEYEGTGAVYFSVSYVV